MRSFIAVELPEGILKRVSEAQAKLPQGLRPVSQKNMHITLAFLGEISEERAREVSAAMGALDCSAFPLSCAGLGAFPSRKSARILWAGIESPGLLKLQKGLEQKLSGLGFEKGDFTPHMTIARAKSQASLDSLLEKYSGFQFGSCTISSIFLKKSTLAPEGPVYETLYEHRLRSVKI